MSSAYQVCAHVILPYDRLLAGPRTSVFPRVPFEVGQKLRLAGVVRPDSAIILCAVDAPQIPAVVAVPEFLIACGANGPAHGFTSPSCASPTGRTSWPINRWYATPGQSSFAVAIDPAWTKCNGFFVDALMHVQ